MSLIFQLSNSLHQLGYETNITQTSPDKFKNSERKEMKQLHDRKFTKFTAVSKVLTLELEQKNRMKIGLKKKVLKNHIVSEYDLLSISKDAESNSDFGCIEKISIKGQKMSDSGNQAFMGKRISKVDAATQTIYGFEEISRNMMLSKSPTWKDRMNLLSESFKETDETKEIRHSRPQEVAFDNFAKSRSYSAPDLYSDMVQVNRNDNITTNESPYANKFNEDKKQVLNRFRLLDHKVPGKHAGVKIDSKATQCFDTDLETIHEDSIVDEVFWC